MENNCSSIDCSIHDELESFAIRGTTVKFQFIQNGKWTTEISKIKTFTSKGSIEHLVTTSGISIRLDRLIFANQIHIANPFYTKVNRLKNALKAGVNVHSLINSPIAELIPIDLSKSNTALSTIEINDIEGQHNYIFGAINEANAIGAIGGYGEFRQWYQRNSNDYGSGDEARVIHIGTDVWLPTSTPLFAPLAGTVHSFANNVGVANYGPTIILEHTLNNDTFYTLYGHLSASSLENISIGQQFQAGDLLATVGNPNENGDWPPHVHVQIMADMLGWQGDFPGVCTHYEAKFYLDCCLNPSFLGL